MESKRGNESRTTNLSHQSSSSVAGNRRSRPPPGRAVGVHRALLARRHGCKERVLLQLRASGCGENGERENERGVRYEGKMRTEREKNNPTLEPSLSSLIFNSSSSPLSSFLSELKKKQMDWEDDAPPHQGALPHAGSIDAALAAYGVPGIEQPGGAATQLPPSVSNSSAAAAALAAAAANNGKIPRGSTGLGGPPPGARGGGPASAPGGSIPTGSDDPPGPKPDVCAFFCFFEEIQSQSSKPCLAVDFPLDLQTHPLALSEPQPNHSPLTAANPYITTGALPPFGAHGRDFDLFWQALDHHWSSELPTAGAPPPVDYKTRKFGVPTVCSDRLNLASLYREVCLRGGHAAVGEAKWWKRVGSALAGVEAATRSTALGTVLKYAYEKW